MAPSASRAATWRFGDSDLVDCLERRADEAPERVLYRFLPTGEGDGEVLTRREVARRSRGVAAVLADAGLVGQRVLLLYPPGLAFATAFFGCLDAGAVAVPAYPPRNRRDDRLLAILADARPRAVLTTSALRSRVESWLAAHVDRAEGVACLATDRVLPAGGGEPRLRRPEPDGLAFLQYTSGSTALPKGVMVTHANLLHNEALIRDAFGMDESSVVVGWLPLFHDMGLIGNLLQPLYCGGEAILMPPAAFLQKPLRWLAAISRHGADTSGGPDFAYDLCCRRIAPEDRERLSLGRWRVAFDGAEPIRPSTLRRFADAFGPCGFDRRAFVPCYGLAEATLLVSGAARAEPPQVFRADAAALEEGGVTEGTAEAEEGRVRELAASGPVAGGFDVAVVEPGTRRRAEPGRVGEIWISGPSVARGYWGRDDETASTFGALLDDGGGPYLRTGDLGFVDRHGGNQLFITGRLKDLIVVRGRNLYPQDLEHTAARAHAGLRPGGGAAFGVEAGGRERLVLVHEVERGASPDLAELAEAVRLAVAREHRVRVFELVAIRYGTLPRTSSGKVRRRACRALYLDGELAEVGRSRLDDDGHRLPELLDALGWEAPAGLGGPEERRALVDLLGLRVARLLGAREPPPPERPLTSLGLDSLGAFELQNGIEEAFGVRIAVESLFAGATLEDLADRIVAARGEADTGPALRAVEAAEGPLSDGQEALWFLHRLAPESAAYNLAVGFRVEPSPDLDRLAVGLTELARRHPVLATVYRETPTGLVQRIEPGRVAAPEVHDAEDWTPERLRGELSRRAEASFDLEAGPPFRVHLFRRRSAPDVLLFAIHHIACDFASLALLLSELGELYAAGIDAVSRPAGAPRYLDYARWQRRRSEGAAGERLWAYWRETLTPPPPPLQILADRPRPAVQTYRGGTRRRRLGADLAAALDARAARWGTTRFTILLAGFAALLHRLGGGDDLVVGSPASARVSPELEGMVGYLVNPVPLRIDASGDPTAEELVERVGRTVAGALAHRELPFPRITERLGLERDPSRSPLYQVLFSYRTPPPGAPAGIAPLAVGEGGARVAFGGLILESVRIPRSVAQLDLELALAPSGDGLAVLAEHNADLFDGTTVERLLGHFGRMLESLVERPDLRLSELSLLSSTEREQLVRQWNDVGSGPRERRGLVERVERQAGRSPDAVAVESPDGCLSYAELAARARRLAAHLRARGVGPEVRVGVHLEPGRDLPVALLGVLRAGGAYVPLDPSLPPRRLALIAGDAGLSWVLARGEAPEPIGGRAPVLDPAALAVEDRAEPAAPEADVPPERLAYVLYTSGSTGRPKGVQVAHGSVVAFLDAMAEAPGLAPGESILAVTPLSFDISVLEIFLPLVRGGRVVLASRRVARDGAALAAALADSRIDALQATPATWKMLLAAGWRDDRRRRLLCGGEALSPDLAGDLARRGELWNLYGPTETTVWSTVARVDRPPADGTPVSIGRPIPGTRVQVTDRRMEPVPVGVAGELSIAGAGVARGYLGRPALTAERFVPDPFSPDPGGRLYRTGDRARHRAGGEVEFLGRLDDQLKVRGFRVEPGEIEAALRRHPRVADAVVLGAGEASGEGFLVAHVVPAPGAEPRREPLRRHLESLLPAYMIPSVWAFHDRLPTTPSGKIDRRSLPAPGSGVRPGEVAYVAPRNPREERIAAIWSQVLGVGRIGVLDDFFALGGHSLLAARVAAEIRDALGVEVSLATLFRNPTVAGTAEAVGRSAGPSPLPPVTPVVRSERAPVSFAQERLWLLEQLRPGTPTYHMAAIVRLAGPLRPAALAVALAGIVRRHEILRTVIGADAGRPYQRVMEPAAEAPPTVDLGGLSAGARGREVGRLVRREARRTFRLDRRPPRRFTLLRLGPEEHALLLVAHHLIADGESVPLFLDELAALYEAEAAGRPATLPPLEVQYADYAAWQRRHLAGERGAEIAALWRRRLAGAPAVELPTDRPRADAVGFRGGTVRRRLPRALARGVLELARRRGATSFEILFAAFGVLLARYGGRSDGLVAVPVADRGRGELARLVGLFVHLLALRLDLGDGPTFDRLLDRVRESVLSAHENRGIPVEALVSSTAGSGATGRHPLFRVSFAEERPPAPRRAGALTLETEPVDTGTAKLDLSLAATWRGDDLELWAEHSAELFDPSTVARLLGHLETLLADALRRPDESVRRLELSGAAERRQLLWDWNDTAADFGEPPFVHRRVEAVARRAPSRTAVRSGDRRMTYGELAEGSARLARRLRALGVGPEVVVGVYLERVPELVTTLLAILRAGGAYLPLDPGAPTGRLERMVADAGSPVVVSDRRLAGEAPAGGARVVTWDEEPTADESALPALPPDGLRPENLAYVIFTSGSTGRPKGVALTHRGLANLVDWHRRAHAVTPDDRASHLAALGFDASVWELWPYLAAGAEVDLLPRGRLTGAAELAGWLDEREVTIGFLPTPLAEAVLDDPSPPPRRLRRLLTGGDRLRRRPASGLPYAVINHYGPTESTVVATAGPVDSAGAPASAGPPSIGRPIANLRAHALDPELGPVPVGAPGELYLGGTGLARGYLGRPGETARRFVPDPHGPPGSRLYRTGDRVRYLRDGALDFLGRVDHQVQVRGVRIEPGEIEAALAAHPAVREVAVISRPPAGDGGEARLTAYVVPAAGEEAAPSILRAFLRERLPPEMVPAVFVELAEIPTTRHGKVDRAALPEPVEVEERAGLGQPVAPRSDLEAWLAGLWAELLERETVGVHDDFFALGGDSLRVVRMAGRVTERFGVDVPPRAFFGEPTVAGLAVRIVEALVEGAASRDVDEAFAEMGRRTAAEPELAGPMGATADG